jgi:hypothetical protein
MVLVIPVDGKGPGALRCLECDQIDPLELPIRHGLSASFALQSNRKPRYLPVSVIDPAPACGAPMLVFA